MRFDWQDQISLQQSGHVSMTWAWVQVCAWVRVCLLRVYYTDACPRIQHMASCHSVTHLCHMCEYPLCVTFTCVYAFGFAQCFFKCRLCWRAWICKYAFVHSCEISAAGHQVCPLNSETHILQVCAAILPATLHLKVVSVDYASAVLATCHRAGGRGDQSSLSDSEKV